MAIFAVSTGPNLVNGDQPVSNGLWPASRKRGGGGPPPPYHASAVHFDGSAFLALASMTASDSGKLTIAGWVKMSDKSTWPHSTVYPICDFDPANNADGLVLIDDGVSGIEIDFNIHGSGVSGRFSWFTSAGAFPNDAAWHSLIVSGDFGLGAGLKLFACYLDGVAVSGTGDDGGADALTIPFSGMKVGINDTTDDQPSFQAEDAANFLIWPGVSIVQSDGTISPADLTNFIAGGKPVNPAMAVSAYGAPAISCTGDDTAFGNNGGSGGTLTTTGTLTNASSSPSD